MKDLLKGGLSEGYVLSSSDFENMLLGLDGS